MGNHVTLTEEAQYCLLRIDDGKANALSFALLADINGALEQAAATGKVLVVTGRPGKFSAGFDLGIMGQGGEPMRDLLLGGARLSRALLDFPTPVVLAVTGHALAMGALLLLAADYRIGVDGDFKLGLNEVAIGMTLPYFGVELARSRLAPNHFGRAVSLASIYTPSAAVEAGFLDEVVPEGELESRAIAVAQGFATLDLLAHRETRARAREDLNAALDHAFERELMA